MTDTERQQILKMVEDGKITAEEGLKLMQTIEEDSITDAPDSVETGSSGEAEGERKNDPEFDRKIHHFRRLWMIPLWVGILLTVLSAWWMYSAMQSSGIGFWFYCAWLPFLLGVGVVALGLDSRTSRWIYMDVHQPPGERPQRIVVSFPLAPVSWLVSLCQGYIPAEYREDANAVLQAIFRSADSDEPLLVDVHEEDGQHVQVYIG